MDTAVFSWENEDDIALSSSTWTAQDVKEFRALRIRLIA